MSRLIKKKAAQQALKKVVNVSDIIKKQLDPQLPLTEQLDKIRKTFDERLGQDEYFLVVDETGYSPLHTNRLREGRVFSDEVGKKPLQQKNRFCSCISVIQEKFLLMRAVRSLQTVLENVIISG